MIGFVRFLEWPRKNGCARLQGQQCGSGMGLDQPAVRAAMSFRKHAQHFAALNEPARSAERLQVCLEAPDGNRAEQANKESSWTVEQLLFRHEMDLTRQRSTKQG